MDSLQQQQKKDKFLLMRVNVSLTLKRMGEDANPCMCLFTETDEVTKKGSMSLKELVLDQEVQEFRCVVTYRCSHLSKVVIVGSVRMEINPAGLCFFNYWVYLALCLSLCLSFILLFCVLVQLPVFSPVLIVTLSQPQLFFRQTPVFN